MRKVNFTRIFAAKYAFAAMLLFGGIAGSFAMRAALSSAPEAQVGANGLSLVTISPDPSASQENHLASIEKITLTFDENVSKENTDGISFKQLGDDVDFAKVSCSASSNTVNIALDREVTEYGKFVLSIPVGAIESATPGKTNEAI